MLNVAVPQGFKVEGAKITRDIKAHKGLDFPSIEEIDIGKACGTYDALLMKIGKSSHDNCSKFTGFAVGQERLASPVYVTVSPELKPIVTRLKAVFKTVPTDTDNSKKFISDILEVVEETKND